MAHPSLFYKNSTTMGNQKNLSFSHLFKHICSVDQKNLDSSQIASFVVNSVKANPSIPIKTIIMEIKNRLGYLVTYKKTWVAKQKALAMEFGDWDESYNHLPRWLQVGTVVQYITRLYVVVGVQDESNYVLERVFWSFKPCIEGFKYCKPIVQVDGQFLTGKYHDTLLTAIGQDGNQNIFSLAFAIVEGETKEVLIWFFQLLQAYVTPQSNLCMTTDRGTTILSTLQSPKVVSEEDGLTLVYCIRHIASNFNKRFKNVDLKRKLINMGKHFLTSITHFKHFTTFSVNIFFEIVTGYVMKQLTLQAKLSAMQAEFPQAVS